MISAACKLKKELPNSKLDFSIRDVLNLTAAASLKNNFDFVFTDRLLINLNSWELQQQGIEQIASCVKENGLLVIIENFTQSYAKRSDPSLRIPIFPLAISGIFLNNDNQVLLGKRKGVSEYQDWFEFVPSGGLYKKNSAHNSVDYEQQLIDELEEETKLDKFSISSINTLGLVFDPDNNVFDICCLMIVTSSVEMPLSTSEYEGLECLDLNDTRINITIPTSKALLCLFRGCN